MTKIHTGFHLKCSWILNSSRCSTLRSAKGRDVDSFLSFMPCRLRVEGRTFLMFGCDERKLSQVLHNLLDSGSRTRERTVGRYLPSMSVSTWKGEATEKCSPYPPPRTSVHTRTAISRLINCESRSLETLNHSFSILSRATSLATLTRGSTLFTQQWRRRQQRWWARGIYSRWRHPMWTVRLGAEM